MFLPPSLASPDRRFSNFHANQRRNELKNADCSNYSEQFKRARIAEGSKAIKADEQGGYNSVEKYVSDARDAAEAWNNMAKWPGRYRDPQTKQTAGIDEQTARTMPLNGYKPTAQLDSFLRSRKIDAASALVERVASDPTLQDHAPTAGVPSYADVLGRYKAQTGVSLTQQTLADLESALRKVQRVKQILTTSGINEGAALIQVGAIAQAEGL